MNRLLTIMLVAECLALAGCQDPAGQAAGDFQAEDPSLRIQAVARAGQTRDAGSVPFLVDRLTDSQTDVRFFAIIALKRITGETMGWNYYEPPLTRAEAVARWRQWLIGRCKDAAATQEANGK